jgi:protein-L-isoaspartate(D-aspartate) O-methyltransferase
MEKTVETLKLLGIIRRKEVEEAIKKIPREEFLPEEFKKYAYVDTPIPVGYGQTTSAIHMVAMLCEHTELKKGDNVLEIGAGSGYMASVYQYITKSEVVTIEVIKELAKFAKKNLRKLNLDYFIHVINADATHSLPFRNKFDVIIVTACSKDIPLEYINYLENEGRLIIPVGLYEFGQELILVRKKDKKIYSNKICDCAFVPLKGTGKVYKND